MNLNIFWALYVFAFAIALYLVAYFFGWKKMHKKERCTEKTTGKVVRYSYAEYNGIRLPVAAYEVDGVQYKVTGPHFKAGVNMYASIPFADVETAQTSNLTSEENLPDVIVTKQIRNSRASITRSPMYDLFPVGKEVDVYYNPKKPKEAYVIRYAAPYKFLSFWLPLICAVICTVLGIVFLANPIF